MVFVALDLKALRSGSGSDRSGGGRASSSAASMTDFLGTFTAALQCQQELLAIYKSVDSAPLSLVPILHAFSRLQEGKPLDSSLSS